MSEGRTMQRIIGTRRIQLVRYPGRLLCLEYHSTLYKAVAPAEYIGELARMRTVIVGAFGFALRIPIMQAVSEGDQ